MAEKTLQYISSKMKNIDLCMFTTKSGRGTLTSRPMSNNGDVKYDGNSYFFSFEKTKKVKEILDDSSVNLTFNTKEGMFISVAGKARIIKSKTVMQEHWVPSLNQWFNEGVDTPGVVMIVVKANRIKYWYKMKEGEVKVP
ncbi:pyridoxamine 5'-phosphate oxidase family protein [Foetidibacter luteolus]|uniref:pyridoxamine 5'-phosphate oxidase family protein n=1 Tax=Foetidibacter luteolus TaxID=2608880 RepID=UPI00129ACDA7|nr:pyridoxamine 5'-phosphate oxidase family protein [Foetidibacter luteolus]